MKCQWFLFHAVVRGRNRQKGIFIEISTLVCTCARENHASIVSNQFSLISLISVFRAQSRISCKFPFRSKKKIISFNCVSGIKQTRKALWYKFNHFCLCFIHRVLLCYYYISFIEALRSSTALLEHRLILLQVSVMHSNLNQNGIWSFLITFYSSNEFSVIPEKSLNGTLNDIIFVVVVEEIEFPIYTCVYGYMPSNVR